METEATLVRPDCIVELDAEPPVHMDFAFVVNPGNPEHDNPVRFDNALIYLCFDKFGVLLCGRLEAFEHFLCGLMELELVRVSLLYLFQHVSDHGHESASLCVVLEHL